LSPPPICECRATHEYVCVIIAEFDTFSSRVISPPTPPPRSRFA
jgi:hypothetical protein